MNRGTIWFITSAGSGSKRYWIVASFARSASGSSGRRRRIVGSWRSVFTNRVNARCTSSTLPLVNSSTAARAIAFVSAVDGRSGIPGNSAVTGARIRRSELIPLRPTAMYDAAGRSRRKRVVVRTRFTFIGPTRPRSVVMRTIATFLTSRRASSGLSVGSAYGARSFNTERSFSSNGREARTASWARRIFDAATSCIARVSCWMFLIDRTRRRRSLSLGIRVGLLELLDHRLRLRFDLLVELHLLGDRVGELAVLGLHEAEEVALEVLHLRRRDVVEVATRDRVDDHDLLHEGQRLVLRLLHHFDGLLAAPQLLLRRLVEVGAELGEGRELAVLRDVGPQALDHGVHGLPSRVAADPGHRQAGVHRRADPLVEQVGLEVDLAVGDRGEVRRDVGRDVVRLGLDDRERRERPAAIVRVQARGALEEPGVQVEDVPRVGLAAWRAPRQQGDLAVGPGVLREVVVDHERVLAAVAEVLAHRAAGERRKVLEGRRVRCAGDDDDAVLHRAMLLERGDDLRDRGVLLPDRDVDADEVLTLLVDDRVDRDRGLAGLAVADDELALAAADRRDRVDDLDPGLDRRVDVLPSDDARRHDVHRTELLQGDLALAVERAAERIDDAAHELRPDAGLDDPAGRADLAALLDAGVVAEDDRAHGVLFEVEGEAEDVLAEVEQLGGHATCQPVDPRDAVTDLDDGADVGGLGAPFELLDLGLDDVGDL